MLSRKCTSVVVNIFPVSYAIVFSLNAEQNFLLQLLSSAVTVSFYMTAILSFTHGNHTVGAICNNHRTL